MSKQSCSGICWQDKCEVSLEIDDYFFFSFSYSELFWMLINTGVRNKWWLTDIYFTMISVHPSIDKNTLYIFHAAVSQNAALIIISICILGQSLERILQVLSHNEKLSQNGSTFRSNFRKITENLTICFTPIHANTLFPQTTVPYYQVQVNVLILILRAVAQYSRLSSLPRWALSTVVHGT